jgi:hypothetical protein
MLFGIRTAAASARTVIVPAAEIVTVTTCPLPKPQTEHAEQTESDDEVARNCPRHYTYLDAFILNVSVHSKDDARSELGVSLANS